jgi:ribosome-associated protein
MIEINEKIGIPDNEVTFEAIRAQGAGGQHVNKSSTAIQLRFDIGASSLPAPVKSRLLRRRDRRITKDGVVMIKAQQHRSQEQNRAEAIERLVALVRSALYVPKQRKPTRVSRTSVERRIAAKKRLSQKKEWRKKPDNQA